MRAQYSIEVILVVAGFFLVISVFAGMYVGFVGEEQELGTRAKLELEAGRIRNAVNHVYVMGPGNEIVLEIGLEEYELEVEGKVVRLEAGGIEVEKEAFADFGESGVEVEDEEGEIKISWPE